MKPITLKVKGINSFQQEQVIDFESLVSHGLFGIFGPTGSGKSTILDAMTIALYDQIPRNTKQFIHKEMTNAFVSFEFEIASASGPSRYIVERSFKRTESAMCKTAAARLLKRTSDTECKVLAEKSREVTAGVEGIIGLKYDDFTRSVVLPQGKFSEFLNLTGRERRDMLERIFHLEKYGAAFAAKIRRATADEYGKMKNIEAKLSVYGNITEEKVKEEQKELEALVKRETALSIELKNKIKLRDEGRALFEICTELERWKEKNKILFEKKTEIDKLQEKLFKAEAAETVIPLVESLQQTNQQFDQADEEEKKVYSRMKEADEKLKLAQEAAEKAVQKKALEYAPLIQRGQALKQALQRKKELKEISDEITKLLEEHQGKAALQKKNKEIFNQLRLEGNHIDEEFIKLEQERNTCTVDNERREKIRAAWEAEQKAKEAGSLAKAALERWKASGENYAQAKDYLSKLKEETKKLVDQEAELSGKLEALNAGCPGGQKELYALSEKVNHSQARWTEALKEKEKADALQKELADINKKYTVCLDKRLQQESDLNKSQGELKERELQIKSIRESNMAEMLSELLEEGSPCPVCGSTHHPNPAPKAVQKLSKELEGQRDKLSRHCSDLEKKIAGLEAEANGYFREMEGKQKELESLHPENIEALAAKFQDVSNEFHAFEEKLTFYEKEKKYLEITLESLQQTVHQAEMKEAAATEAASSLSFRMREREEEKETAQAAEKTAKDFLQKFQLVLGEIDYSKELEQYRLDDLKRDKILLQEKNLRIRRKAIEDETRVLLEEIGNLQGALSALSTEGKEKRRIETEKKAELEVLSGGEDPESTLNKVKNRIDDLEQTEKMTQEELKNCREMKNTVTATAAAVTERTETLRKFQVVQRQNLLEKLKEQGFDNQEQALSYVLEQVQQEKIRSTLKNYQQETIDTANNLKRLTEKAAGKTIDKNSLLALEKSEADTKNQQEETAKAAAVKANVLKDMEEKLGAVLELKKEEIKVRHKHSLLAEISQIMEGNRFVEYMAADQLHYITKEASVRLKSMTKGRYALELSANGEFIMRDDFNGGTRREPNTLSGGETFLTSFCLALALSSKIQMKNNAPLQFFFLDEGFGTLDSTVLDVVMTSLESLYQQQLHVGVITHIEELKERIPLKLMVIPGEQGISGTTTRLESM